jgi:hypothetical protein
MKSTLLSKFRHNWAVPTILLTLGRTAARISIVILALGFSLLGFLSLTNKHQVCAEDGISFEHAFSIIGGTTSFLLGWIFLIAGTLNWKRSLSHTKSLG